MTRIVDKYEFKNYIKEKLGDGYTVPLLGVWDRVVCNNQTVCFYTFIKHSFLNKLIIYINIIGVKL